MRENVPRCDAGGGKPFLSFLHTLKYNLLKKKGN